MDTRSNSRANTCHVFIRSRPAGNNSKREPRRETRGIMQVSALSALDGSVLDYHGSDGDGELGFDSGEGA